MGSRGTPAGVLAVALLTVWGWRAVLAVALRAIAVRAIGGIAVARLYVRGAWLRSVRRRHPGLGRRRWWGVRGWRVARPRLGGGHVGGRHVRRRLARRRRRNRRRRCRRGGLGRGLLLVAGRRHVPRTPRVVGRLTAHLCSLSQRRRTEIDNAGTVSGHVPFGVCLRPHGDNGAAVERSASTLGLRQPAGDDRANESGWAQTPDEEPTNDE